MNIQMKLLTLLAAVLSSIACGPKRRPNVPQNVAPPALITFKNCKVTRRDPNGNALSCSCGHFSQGVDAQTGHLVVLCAE